MGGRQIDRDHVSIDGIHPFPLGEVDVSTFMEIFVKLKKEGGT